MPENKKNIPSTPQDTPKGREEEKKEGGGLNERQRAFCEEYINTQNATKSYQKVYDVDYETAKTNGPRLLANAHIKAYIDSRIPEIYQRLGITPERILKEYARIAYFDPAKMLNEDGKLKEISEIDEDTRAVIAGVEVEALFEGKGKDREFIGTLKKVKIADKKGALDSLARHMAMFKDKIEHSGSISIDEWIKKKAAKKNGSSGN